MSLIGCQKTEISTSNYINSRLELERVADDLAVPRARLDKESLPEAAEHVLDGLGLAVVAVRVAAVAVGEDAGLAVGWRLLQQTVPDHLRNG